MDSGTQPHLRQEHHTLDTGGDTWLAAKLDRLVALRLDLPFTAGGDRLTTWSETPTAGNVTALSSGPPSAGAPRAPWFSEEQAAARADLFAALGVTGDADGEQRLDPDLLALWKRR